MSTPTLDEITTDVPRLTRFAQLALEVAGFTRADAGTAADALVRASARGLGSHGIWLLPTYVGLTEAGGVDPRALTEAVVDAPAMAVLDGHDGLGILVAHRAATVAIDKARTSGVAVVAVRQSNHFGAAGHYALQCAEAGVIGLVMANSPPCMTLEGTRGKVIGSQPLAYGIPAADDEHLVFDAAMSTIAGRRVVMAAEKGLHVPDDWVVDADGFPTTDPTVLRGGGGSLRHFGAHKGSALALLVEVLSGALSGAAMLSDVSNFITYPERPTGTGHVVMALDIGAFMDPAAFQKRLARLTTEVRAAPRAPGIDEILLPGDRERTAERRALAEGLVLDGPVWGALSQMAARLELKGELESARR